MPDEADPLQVEVGEEDGEPVPDEPADDETVLGWSYDVAGASASRPKRFDFRNAGPWIGSIAMHAIALAIGFSLFSVVYRPPRTNFQRGDGVMPGGYLQNAQSLVEEATLPKAAEARESQSRDLIEKPSAENDPAIAQSFSAPAPPAADIIAADSVQFGIGNPNPLQRTPAPRHRDIPAAASHASSAASTDAPAPRPTAAASGAGTQKEHVRTPPHFVGREGAHGSGGSTDGVDDRGLPIPDYPAISRRRGEQGVVELEIEVMADGRVGKVTVCKDGGYPRLAAAATTAMQNAHLTPATLDGAPVAGKLIVPYRFVLK